MPPYYPGIGGLVSTANQTTSTLIADTKYTGSAEVVAMYASVTLSISSDVPSAACGVQIQFSPDGTNWDRTVSWTYQNNADTFTKTIEVDAKYLRVVYTNGSTGQSYFRLQLLLNVSTEPRDTSQQISFPIQYQADFNRLRACSPVTVLDVSYVTRNTSILETELKSGTATGTLNTNAPVYVMAVAAGTGSITRQTRARGVYLPGKSILCIMTGIINARTGKNQANVIARIGAFDDNNGVFFQHNGDGGAGTMQVVVRSDCTGSVAETTISQTSWNIDPMDGTGSSGIQLDFTKTLIFTIAYEWLGVGAVKFGFVLDGALYFVHSVRHSNLEIIPYMGLGTLPLRSQLDTTSGAGELHRICNSIVSEGGYIPRGNFFSYSFRANGNQLPANTTVPIMSLRINPAYPHNRVNVHLDSFGVLTLYGGINCLVQLWIFRDQNVNSVLTNGNRTFTSVGSYSSCQYNTLSTTINTTLGSCLQSVYYSRAIDSAFLPVGLSTGTNEWLTVNLSGQSDILVITGHSLASSDYGYACMNWREVI